MFNILMRYREPYVIWFAILLHLLWTVDMFTDPLAGQATAPFAVKVLLGSAAPYLLFLGCLLAFIGMTVQRRGLTTLLCLPQLFILCVSAYGAISAIMTSHFADGVIRPRMFIASDQEPAIILAVLYVWVLIQIARGKY